MWNRTGGLLAATALCLATTACAAGSTSTPAAPPTTATSPPQAAEPTPAPPPTSPLSPTPAPTAAPTAPAAAASSASAPGLVTLTIDGNATQASFHAHEQLVGNALPNEAVGSTSAVSGAIVLNQGAIDASQSQVTVELSSLKSDQSRRDNFIKSNTLQTSQYPTATFVPHDAVGLPSPLPTAGQATFQLLGDLTVHGITRPASWQVTAQFDDTTISGDATTDVNITDFGMTPPKAGPVLSIEDGITLEVAFTAQKAATAAS